MPGIEEALTGLIDGMLAVATPQAGGRAVAATVAPLPGDLDVTEILQGSIDLTWITKDVLFGDENPEDSLAPADLATAIIDGLPLGGLNPPTGTPGLLGQLRGTVPLTSATKLKPTITVTWTVLDERKQPLDQGQYAVGAGHVEPGSTTIEGLEIAVAFLPDVEELVSDKPPGSPKPRYLRAHVTLTASGITVERDLPDLPVLVPPLAIPKVLAAFIHSNFQARDGDDDGGVLIMVPGNSPLRSVEQLNSTLGTLQETLTTLKSFAGFAAFLLGVSELVGALSATPYFAFAATNEIDNLNDITLIQRAWYSNDTELEDELSSMIFVGPAGKKLDVFCETDFDDENGRFKLTIGDNHYSLIRSMHSDDPVSEPSGQVEVLVDPTHIFIDDGDLTFGDWSSSLRFL